jgi:hypothetical protein
MPRQFNYMLIVRDVSMRPVAPLLVNRTDTRTDTEFCYLRFELVGLACMSRRERRFIQLGLGMIYASERIERPFQHTVRRRDQARSEPWNLERSVVLVEPDSSEGSPKQGSCVVIKFLPFNDYRRRPWRPEEITPIQIPDQPIASGTRARYLQKWLSRAATLSRRRLIYWHFRYFLRLWASEPTS